MRAGRGRGGADAARLGTFAGVFTPSVLTILGIILFRRVGYIVGAAGLLETLAILGLATLVSVLTSLSLSAIATNLRVRKGGDYFLISRTLGASFGGAIGLVLFLAQAVSIAFYTIGFGEAVAGMLGRTEAWAVPAIAAAATALLFAMAWVGADVATKFQFLVMGLLVVALGAFGVGACRSFDVAHLQAAWSPPDNAPPFWVLFAVFFPAVTGFTQGVSMSGDLRDPSTSLPRGTFAAVAVSTVVYLVAVVAFAGAASLAVLSSDYEAMRKVSAFPWLVDAGVVAATLSSAMASFLGAPRILQALAADGIFGFLAPFAKGSGPSDNPRRGVLLSAVLAGMVIAAGNLDLIARLVSMFFLISYGLLNYATYYEASAGSPSFRPRFRYFDARLSLLGAVACLGIMLAIDPVAGLVSCVLLLAVDRYLRIHAPAVNWSDSRRAHAFSRIREYLRELSATPESPRDWRPHILVFSDDAHRREKLLRFGWWIEGGAGLTTAVRVVVGQGRAGERVRVELEKKLEKEIAEVGVPCFALTVMARDLLSGARVLVQAYGIGALRANTVLMNWIDQAGGEGRDIDEATFGSYLRMALRLGRNVVVLRSGDQEWAALGEKRADQRRIDVWWVPGSTGRLLLLLAYLMTRTPDWIDADIRVLVPVRADEDAEAARARSMEMLVEVRIDADVVTVADPCAETLASRCADAAVVLLPLRFREDLPRDPFGGRLEELLPRLPVTALVLAAEEIDLGAEPDREQAEPEQLPADLDRSAGGTEGTVPEGTRNREEKQHPDAANPERSKDASID